MKLNNFYIGYNSFATMRQIEYVVSALKKLIDHTHRNNLDRCCVGVFNNRLVTKEFESNSDCLQKFICDISEPNEGCAVYDCIFEMTSIFAACGDNVRPWVTIVITIGVNDQSVTYNASNCVNRDYAIKSNHNLYVITVGGQSNITIPHSAVHVPTISSASLDDIISKIIIQTSMDKRRSVAVDYALLIDVSKTMSELATAKCFYNHALTPHWYGFVVATIQL